MVIHVALIALVVSDARPALCSLPGRFELPRSLAAETDDGLTGRPLHNNPAANRHIAIRIPAITKSTVMITSRRAAFFAVIGIARAGYSWR